MSKGSGEGYKREGSGRASEKMAAMGTLVDRVRVVFQGESMLLGFFVGVNILTSTLLVSLNKLLFSVYNYPQVTLVSSLHSCLTWGVVHAASSPRFAMFERKEIPIKSILPFAILQGLSIPFANASLHRNSLGFYQIMKIMQTPTIAFVQYMLYGRRVSRNTLLTLLMMMIGAALISVSDTSTTTLGFCVAVCSAAINSIAQIWTQEYQQQFQCDAYQLLHALAPSQALISFLAVFLFDDVSFSSERSLWNYTPTMNELILIIVTGGIAVIFNISLFTLCGRGSALLYQVVGYFKTCLVLIIGFMFFDGKATPRVMLGVGICLTGLVAYNLVKRWEAAYAPLPQVQSDEYERDGSDADADPEAAVVDANAADEGQEMKSFSSEARAR